MKQILKDKYFEKGFNIGHVNSLTNPNTIKPWKLSNENPDWKICQWCSNYSLQDNAKTEHDEFLDKIYNEQKEITRFKNGSLILSIKTDKEYKHDRLNNDGWPHLLIEQFFDNVNLSKLNNLNVDINFDFVSFFNHMKNNNELHTFQVTWYFCISNRNKLSKGYQDFFWFGIPFIDTPRFAMGQPYEAVDSGKEDASNKYIISINPKNYIFGETKIGSNLKFSGDILPNIKNAFNRAKEKGFLKSTNFEDLELISTNFGIEDTGTFDGSIKINSINIYEK